MKEYVRCCWTENQIKRNQLLRPKPVFGPQFFSLLPSYCSSQVRSEASSSSDSHCWLQVDLSCRIENWRDLTVSSLHFFAEAAKSNKKVFHSLCLPKKCAFQGMPSESMDAVNTKWNIIIEHSSSSCRLILSVSQAFGITLKLTLLVKVAYKVCGSRKRLILSFARDHWGRQSLVERLLLISIDLMMIRARK